MCICKRALFILLFFLLFQLLSSPSVFASQSPDNQLSNNDFIAGGLKWETEPEWDFSGTMYLSGLSHPVVSRRDDIAVSRSIFVDGDNNYCLVYVYDISGTLNWRYQHEDCDDGTLTFGKDSTLYFTSGYYRSEDDQGGEITAIDKSGDALWTFSTEATLRSSAAVDLEGTIYVTSTNTLYALNPNGTLKWQRESNELSFIYDGPAVGADGIVYLLAQNTVFAYSKDGMPLWQQSCADEIERRGKFAVAADSMIYVLVDAHPLEGALCAIESNGTLMWKKDGRFSGTPVISSEREIVTVFNSKLVRLDRHGNVVWESDTDEAYGNSIALTANGSSIQVDRNNNRNVIGVDKNGVTDWSYNVGIELSQNAKPAIGADGTVYVSDGYQLFAIYSDKGQLANSPWPMPGHDSQGTMNVTTKTKPLTDYDYNNEGLAQLTLRRPDASQFIMRSLGKNQIRRTYFGVLPSDFPLHGDYDGDGIADIAIRRQETSEFITLNSSDNEINRVTFASNTSGIPVNGDFDGDGLSDFAIYEKDTGIWRIQYSSDGSTLNTAFGILDGDMPVPADYDGDGITDIAFRRPDSGRWYIRESSTGENRVVYFGAQSTDIPVTADYDGDGKADLAFRRPHNGHWYIKLSSSERVDRLYFGSQSTDIPVPADYDGDGMADIAVRRPSAGYWFYRSSRDSTIYRIYFGGQVNDIPVAAPLSLKLGMLDNIQSQAGMNVPAEVPVIEIEDVPSTPPEKVMSVD